MGVVAYTLVGSFIRATVASLFLRGGRESKAYSSAYGAWCALGNMLVPGTKTKGKTSSIGVRILVSDIYKIRNSKLERKTPKSKLAVRQLKIGTEYRKVNTKNHYRDIFLVLLHLRYVWSFYFRKFYWISIAIKRSNNAAISDFVFTLRYSAPIFSSEVLNFHFLWFSINFFLIARTLTAGNPYITCTNQ